LFSLTNTQIFRKIYSISFWLFLMKLREETQFDQMRDELVDLLRKKQFRMLARLKEPKDELLEAIPFLLAFTIIELMRLKIKEGVNVIGTELDVYQFTFNLLNGIEISEQAISSLKSKYVDT